MPCVTFGRPSCGRAFRCIAAPNLGEALLKSLPPSQNLFLSILQLVFLPSADEFFVWAPISRARLVLRFGAPVKDLLRFWAPIWPTRLAFPQKPHVSSPPHLCCWPLRISWLGAPLGDSTRFWSPLWPTRLAFPLETPSFFPTAPLSLALSVLLVGRSSCRLASVLGSHFADSPCVPAGNPKFFPHRTSFAGSLGFVGSALPLATRLGFGRPFGRLALRSLWKPQVFSLPRLCRCSLGFVGWALLLATRLGFGRPFGRLALCSLWKPQVFSPPPLCRCSFGFVCWALLLPSRLGFGRPFGRLALHSLWKPQFFSPPHLFRWLFRFCRSGAPLGDSLRFWAPFWPTRLAFPLETPSFFPTAPLSLFFRFCWLGAPLVDSPRFWAPLWPTRFVFPLETPSFFPHRPSVAVFLVLLVGRSSGRLVSVLGAPLADSPCGPSGNPKFSPHRTFVAGSFGFVGWALLLPTRLGFGHPSGRLALRSLWKPQVFSPPHLCRRLFGFCWLGAPLGDSPRCWAPLWPTRLVFPLETPSFLPTAPLSPAFWVLLVRRSSWRLASVLGAPLADSPCVPSGKPKFSPHLTSVSGSLGFVGSALLLATILLFGRPSGGLALRSLWKPQVFSPPHLCRLFFRFCWSGPPLADSPRFWAPISPTLLSFLLGTPSFFPTAPLSLALSVL